MPSSAQMAEAKSLLDLLKENLSTKKLGPKQQADCLEKLKTLGRDAGNVAFIYDKSGIETLGKYAFEDFPASTSQEALRCLANALLLLPQTRRFSIELDLDKNITRNLHTADLDEEFLLARILFLLTYDPTFDIDTLILEGNLAEAVVHLLSRHAGPSDEASVKTPSDQRSMMALSETSKLLFNLTSAKADHIPKFSSAVQDLLVILGRLQIPSPPLQPPMSLVINVIANLEMTDQGLSEGQYLQPAARKLITILDQAVERYTSRELESLGVPLLTVLRKINELAGPSLRDDLKARLLPDDEERDQPLGKSASLPSRLLRLTTSSGLLTLAEAISALQFELSNKDANEYVRNVGYGYGAGYLMSHKIAIPESAKMPASTQSSGDVPTNPITGQRLDRESAMELPQMSQQEKEQEAERLFVLFERLKATGVVDVKNPVEVARDDGRFEELSDSESE